MVGLLSGNYLRNLDPNQPSWYTIKYKFNPKDSTVTPQHKTDYSPFPETKEYENVGREILCLLFDAGTQLIYAAGNTCEVYVHKLHNQKEPEYVTTIRVIFDHSHLIS